MKEVQDPLYADLISFLVQPDTLITSDFLSRVFKVGKNRATRLLHTLKKDNCFKVIEYQKHVFQVTKRTFFYQTSNKDFDLEKPAMNIYPQARLVYEGDLELENTEGIPSFRDFNIRLVLDEENEQLIFSGKGGDQDYQFFTTEWRITKQDIGKAKDIAFKFNTYNSKKSEEIAKLYVNACSPSDDWLTLNIEGRMSMSIRGYIYDFEIVGGELVATRETETYLQQRVERGSHTHALSILNP